ncbi:MAG: DUF2993 domain-containing protein [Synechococcales cyanobacterium]
MSNPFPSPTHRQLISKLLSPAIRLWLHTQVERVETLKVHIVGGDRPILSGKLSGIQVQAHGVVYRGLHFTQIHLNADQVSINLGQVLRGKPFTLLDPVPVTCHLTLTERDLNASLQSPLLMGVIQDLFQRFSHFLVKSPPELSNLKTMTAHIQPNQLTVGVYPHDSVEQVEPVVLRTDLGLHSGRYLRLQNPRQLLSTPVMEQSLPALEGVELDLGEHVAIAQLTLGSGVLVCEGQLIVFPG